MTEEELLKEAGALVDVQAENVFNILRLVAEVNCLEFDWVVKEFRNKFNKRVRKYEDVEE